MAQIQKAENLARKILAKSEARGWDQRLAARARKVWRRAIELRREV